MSLAFKQLVLIAVAFVFLLIQLQLRKSSAKSGEALKKHIGLEEKSGFTDNAKQHYTRRKPKQTDFYKPPKENRQLKANKLPSHVSSLKLQVAKIAMNNQISHKAEHFVDTEIKDRLESTLSNYIKVCKTLPHQKRPSVTKYHSYAFGRLQWCSIPKSGSTFLTRELRPTLKKLGESDPETTKRFMVVREPYSRLVSAFFSKLVGHPAWWFSYGSKIVTRFRLNPGSDSLQCGHDVTFEEFIKFFIFSTENSWYTNAHFLPIHRVCDLCDEPPEFIAKIETIKPDMDYILNSVEVSGETGKTFIEVKHLAKLFMSYKTKFQRCDSMCSLLNRFWWGQQETGLIAKTIALPVKDQACDQVTGEQLADLAWEAHQASVSVINDKQRYKWNVSMELWGQVPMEDRIKVRDILSIDCRLFGYDCSPYAVFPKKKK